MDFTVQLILTLISLLGVFIAMFGFPGIFLVLISLFIYGAYVNFMDPPMWVYIVFFVIAVISTFVDNLGVLIGAKKFGSSKYGVMGAFIGGLIGFFVVFPIGVLPGAFIGAFVADFFVKKDIEKALYGALGTFIGYVSGMILKFILALVLFVWLMTIVW